MSLAAQLGRDAGLLRKEAAGLPGKMDGVLPKPSFKAPPPRPVPQKLNIQPPGLAAINQKPAVPVPPPAGPQLSATDRIQNTISDTVRKGYGKFRNNMQATAILAKAVPKAVAMDTSLRNSRDGVSGWSAGGVRNALGSLAEMPKGVMGYAPSLYGIANNFENPFPGFKAFR